MYAQFGLEIPQSLGEALEMLAPSGNGSRVPIAGGTNVLVDLRARTSAPDTLVSVARLADLRGVREANGQVTMGGCTTVSDILRNPEMRRLGSALVDAADVFAGQMVRNTATVAGNICCGSPAADLVPALLVLDAAVTLESSRSRRQVPLAEYFTGYKQSVRAPDELLTQICWPTPGTASASRFYKLARRKGDAITVVGVAVSLQVEDGRCRSARIALGAVAPFVKRATIAESMLEGKALTPDSIASASRQAAAESSPIDDVRASGEYRRNQVFVLVQRLVAQTWAQLSSGIRES
ncbi:MAG: xanthine dehydrogenase family protein subunit M [Burkholderiaceae bacterium]|nr:xanthine dehydrogenase family protein subunit M [Burkholderiaceae bacterium]